MGCLHSCASSSRESLCGARHDAGGEVLSLGGKGECRKEREELGVEEHDDEESKFQSCGDGEVWGLKSREPERHLATPLVKVQNMRSGDPIKDRSRSQPICAFLEHANLHVVRRLPLPDSLQSQSSLTNSATRFVS